MVSYVIKQNRRFEARDKIVLDIDNQLLCSSVRTEVGQMYDELRQSFEMSQQNIQQIDIERRALKVHAFTINDFCMTCSKNKI
jgi:hypothetical protein